MGSPFSDIGNVAGLFQNAGVLLEHIDDLRHMTLWQWVTLAGWALGGAAAGMAVSSNPVIVGVFVLGAVASHFSGQVQTSPIDRAAATAAVNKDAEAKVAAAEATGQTLIEQADSHKPLDEAAADFSKQMAAKS